MANNIIVSGDEYSSDKILSGHVLQVQSLDGDELQYDTLNFTLTLGKEVTEPPVYKYGTEVIYRHRGNLVGKYYVTAVSRVGRNNYSISCVSPIGLLANLQHYGGIYSGISFSALLNEIIGETVPFNVAPELENQPVYGWLPVATRRDNLHQALFAMGAAAQKDENGDLIFKPLSDEIHTEIPDSRIYISGSVKYPEAVTKVAISEHTFVANDTDETVTLFEGLVEPDRITTPIGAVVQGSLILFNDPMHSLVIDNGEILEIGVNYAVLAPAAECKLTGKKYTHTVRQITRPEAPITKSEDTENAINVTDATLISIANSENVADRLMSYYSSAKTISTDIVVDGERAGSAVQLTDPFGDLTKGIIKSMDINMSNTLKAHTEIIADYSPEGAGNFYTKLDVVSADGAWTVPSGVSKIRAAVIGGGNGGYSGAQGENGGEGQTSTSGIGFAWGTWGDGGNGGAKGQGGFGGRILVLSLNVEEGQTFDISIGSGGAGGVCSGPENTPGAEGSDTTFGEYSSANGTRSATGYADLFGSTAYGLPGLDGLADGADGIGGGAGNEGQPEGDTITIDGVTYVCGSRGKSANATYSPNGFVESIAAGGGGNGGGAAAGANGFDGKDGQAFADENGAAAIGGDGGDGATATIRGEDGAEFGSGGQGGSGGGGGGGGASGAFSSVVGGSGGKGGMGSNGGAGANGCVLIYY